MTNTQAPIWRDGNRLVSKEVGGYADAVPDENLEQHASDPTLHDLDRTFAAAVLAIRRFERASRAETIDRTR